MASENVLFQSLGVVHRVAQYRRSAVIFAQGADCRDVMYLQQGSVKLAVLSPGGKEAIVSVLQPGDFFGEGCLAGQQVHIATAVAVNPSTVAVIGKQHMV
jgi:CRP/FNR family transcriptional regulator, cyclic AMP receptor protein